MSLSPSNYYFRASYEQLIRLPSAPSWTWANFMRRIFCYLRRISHPALIVGPTYEATLALASFARRAARGRSGGGITGAKNSATVFVGE